MTDEASRFFIKAGYVSRPADSIEDTPAGSDGPVHQPDVYPSAAYRARRLGLKRVLDAGGGRPGKLAVLHEHDLESPGPLPIDPALARDAVIVCSDVVERLADPRPLLAGLARLMEVAPIGLLSTPERDLVRGRESMG